MFSRTHAAPTPRRPDGFRESISSFRDATDMDPIDKLELVLLILWLLIGAIAVGVVLFLKRHAQRRNRREH